MSYRDEDLPMVHPIVRATDQAIDAVRDLDRHPDSYLRWPWPDLHAMTGGMGAGGVVWFVCAYSGSGKTSFVTSLIEGWRLQGKRIYAMPLETLAKEFRTRLACNALGIRPGDALSGELRLTPEGEERRKEIKHHVLHTQVRSPWVDQVMVSEMRAVNLRGLKEGLQEAKAFGADVVIIDHIDHIGGDDDKRGYSESAAINRAAGAMAQDNGLNLLLTSQLNLDITRNPDHLARYGPPRDQHVLMGGTKREVATGMIGLYRHLRTRHPNETQEEFAELVQAVKRGAEKPSRVLDDTLMGVNAMKLRFYGEREGDRLALGFDKGKVFSLAERDRYETRPFVGPVRVA
jgi:hypothetical protein